MDTITVSAKIERLLVWKIGGKNVTELTDFSNLFKNAFMSIGVNIPKTIPSWMNDFAHFQKIGSNDRNMFLFPNSYTEVLKALFNSKLARLTGYD